MSKANYNHYILGIVLIVAIIGIVSLLTKQQGRYIENNEYVGQAIIPNKVATAQTSFQLLNDYKTDKQTKIFSPKNAVNSNLPYLENWPVNLGIYLQTTPVLYDLDNDGNLEIIIGSNMQNNYIYVFSNNGTLMTNWTRALPGGFTLYEPAVGDVDGDGIAEIIASSGQKVYVYNNKGILPGWPITLNARANVPVVADVNYDGLNEIIIVSEWTQTSTSSIHVLNKNGKNIDGWPVTIYGPNYNFMLRQAIVADLNNDGDNKIIYGFSKKIYVWDIRGQLEPGWPQTMNSSNSNSGTYLVVSDIDADSKKEIIASNWKSIYVYSPTGNVKTQFINQVGASIYSSPAVFDINGDNLKEIFVVSDSNKANVFTLQGVTANWTITPDPYHSTFSPAMGADVDDDGLMELIISSSDGKVYAYNIGENLRDWSLVDNWPLITGDWIEGAVSVADINNDEKQELVATSWDGKIYVWVLGSKQHYKSTCGDWPMWKMHPRHTGEYNYNPYSQRIINMCD